jgi:hypothetical protein
MLTVCNYFSLVHFSIYYKQAHTAYNLNAYDIHVNKSSAHLYIFTLLGLSVVFDKIDCYIILETLLHLTCVKQYF